MTYVFQEALRFKAPKESFIPLHVRASSEHAPVERGFPLAAALKDFWLCFAPRYAPLLASRDEGKVDPYARAPTQHLFQEDRTAYLDPCYLSGIRFTRVSTSRIPSIAEFVSSFPFIKNLHLTLQSEFDSSLASLGEMRLLTQLCLIGPTPKHLSEIANVSVKNLHLSQLQGNELSSLFPQQEQQQGGRLQRSLRNLDLNFCHELTDISALAVCETLLELKIYYCQSLTNLSSISQLKELRVVRVEKSLNLEMNSFVNAVTSLEFLLELEITNCGEFFDEHVRKIATLEILEKLKLTFLRASSESLSMLLDPQNLPNLRELELHFTASPFKHCVGSGTCVNLEKLSAFTSGFGPELDSTDLSIISKKFPNLKCLSLVRFEDEVDFTPLGDLICLSELTLTLHFRSEFTSVQSASLEAAIPKLVNLKELVFEKLPALDVKKMLVPLRKLECLSCQYHPAVRTMNAVLDLVEEGHLPLFSNFKIKHISGSVSELLQDRRKKRMAQQKQRSKKEELQAARRVREDEK